MLQLFQIHDDPMQMRPAADRWTTYAWAYDERGACVQAALVYPEVVDEFVPDGFFTATPVSRAVAEQLAPFAPGSPGREFRPAVLAIVRTYPAAPVAASRIAAQPVMSF